jgi:CcmD family protein
MQNPYYCSPVIAAAFEPPPSGTSQSPEDRRQEFVAVQGGKDTTSAQSLLVAAYLVMWVLLLGFVFLGWRRATRLEGRLNQLEKALARQDQAKSDE